MKYRLAAQRAALVSIVLGMSVVSGCQAPHQGPPPERDPIIVPATQVEVVASCRVLELDKLSEEVAEVRERVQDGIRFEYGPSSKTLDALVAEVPEYVFVMAHGWQNDVASSREFTGGLIKGIRERATKDAYDPARMAFVAVHWDSKRPLFHESAINAEVIGKRRIAPFLAQLRQRCPQARIVLVGHSLGGRLCLAALDGSQPRTVHAAILLEAAADQDCLIPERTSLVGSFALAPNGCGLIANVCSQQDDVLRLAYANAMRATALGREGVFRGMGDHYPKVTLGTTGLDVGPFEEALRLTNSKADGSDGRVINVDATGVITGHSEVMVPAVFDVIWRVASRPAG